MEEKRKRSELELELCLNSGAEDEPINKVLTLDEAIEFELKHGNLDPNVDLKKLRRTISNRLSAQRARIKRTEYIAELENKVKHLQDTIALVAPEIENQKDKQKMLRLQRFMLQGQLDSITDKSKLRTVQFEEMKLELRRLKELAKAQEEEKNKTIHFLEIEGQSSNSESAEGIDMEQGIDQYLNLDAMNFYPPKNYM